VAAGPYELGPVHAKPKAGDERAAFQVVTAEIAIPEVARDALAGTICATVWSVIEAVPIRGRRGPPVRRALGWVRWHSRSGRGRRGVRLVALVCGWVS
jgi:hypothetical protein